MDISSNAENVSDFNLVILVFSGHKNNEKYINQILDIVFQLA